MAFKVNFNELQTKASAIIEDFKELEKAKTTGSSAGAAAVAAAGGDKNPVGKAIKDAIQDDTNNEFDQAKGVISDMIDALSKVSKVYSNENAELLSKIKTIAAQASGGDGGAGGAGMAGGGSVSANTNMITME